MQTKSSLKIWLLCVNFGKFTSINRLRKIRVECFRALWLVAHDVYRGKSESSVLELCDWSHSTFTEVNFSNFAFIITSVKFQLNVLSAYFLLLVNSLYLPNTTIARICPLCDRLAERLSFLS